MYHRCHDKVEGMFSCAERFSLFYRDSGKCIQFREKLMQERKGLRIADQCYLRKKCRYRADLELGQGVKVKALKSTIADVIPPSGGAPATSA